MPDISLIWRDLSADCTVDLADIAVDNTLRTAVILSLFLDRRAREDDVIPDGTNNRRGWWADTVLEDESGKRDWHGSRLWLLHREKELPEVLRRAKGYADEGLAWLISDGIASKVEVTATNPRSGWLVLDVAITLKSGNVETYSFDTQINPSMEVA